MYLIIQIELVLKQVKALLCAQFLILKFHFAIDC